MNGIVLTFEDWKKAAWLYENVVPIQLVSYEDNWLFPSRLFNWDVAGEFTSGMDDFKYAHRDLIRKAIMPDFAYHSWKNDPNSILKRSNFMHFMNHTMEKEVFDTFSGMRYELPLATWMGHIHSAAINAWKTDKLVPGKEIGFREHIINEICGADVVQLDYVTSESTLLDENVNDWSEFVSICLKNVDLVDTRSLKWDHLLEIRKDPDSIKKLRALRLVFYENVRGKERSYVEDKIAHLLDEYREEVKRQNIETRIGYIEAILTSRSLIAGGGGALLGSLLGKPTIAGISLGVGAVMELGKLTILRRKNNLRLKALENNCLSYIMKFDDQ